MKPEPQTPHQTGTDEVADLRSDENEPRPIRVQLMGREFNLPQSRLLRMALGVGFILLGMMGFLPVLGFWMIPLGLLVLSYDIPAIRRLRRRLAVWWGKRRNKSSGARRRKSSGSASAS